VNAVVLEGGDLIGGESATGGHSDWGDAGDGRTIALLVGVVQLPKADQFDYPPPGNKYLRVVDTSVAHQRTTAGTSALLKANDDVPSRLGNSPTTRTPPAFAR
jgi:hypothetical protein